MDIEKTLKNEFKEVNKSFFEKDMGMNFLRVEVSTRNLQELTNISKKISEFLDINDPSDGDYYLDVFSPGTDETINIKDLSNFIECNVLVNLKKHIKEKNEFIGTILSVDEKELIIKWNAKGQFRKQIIAIENIEQINKYTKLKKNKGVKHGI